jgi:hypothetical protein
MSQEQAHQFLSGITGGAHHADLDRAFVH